LVVFASIAAVAPRASAAQNRPTWTQGDFWVYTRTAGGGTSTVRVDVHERTSLTLTSGTFSVWHVSTTVTDASGNDTVVHSWIQDSNLGIAKANFTVPFFGDVQVTFDPSVTSYDDLLRVYFTVHDPTTLNRQGGDEGIQYRSVIFYHTPTQKDAAMRVMSEIEAAKIWRDPVVTELSPHTEFYRGEEYHQDYFRKNPGAGYCRVVIAPKVAKFRKHYADRLKK